MTRLQSTVTLLALSIFVEWASGCASSGGPRQETRSTASDATVTGTTTLHPHKDSPQKIEQVTGDMLRQAGATHVGQSLQDVPGVQTGH